MKATQPSLRFHTSPSSRRSNIGASSARRQTGSSLLEENAVIAWGLLRYMAGLLGTAQEDHLRGCQHDALSSSSRPPQASIPSWTASAAIPSATRGSSHRACTVTLASRPASTPAAM